MSANGITVRAFVKAVREMKGVVLIPIIFTVSILVAFTEPISLRYLLDWSRNFDEDTKWHSLTVLALLYTLKSVFPPFRRGICFVLFQYNLSLGLHSRMFFKSLHASILAMHDKLPSGTVVNRMTNDLGKVDTKLVDNFGIFMNLVSVLTYLLATILFTIHWSSILLIGLFLAFNAVAMRRYIEVRRTLIKNQSGSMAPVLDLLDDSVSDLTALRVLKQQDRFYDKYNRLIRVTFNMGYFLQGLVLSFNTVISMSSLLLVQVPCLIILLNKDEEPDWNNVIIYIVLVGNLAGEL